MWLLNQFLKLFITALQTKISQLSNLLYFLRRMFKSQNDAVYENDDNHKQFKVSEKALWLKRAIW